MPEIGTGGDMANSPDMLDFEVEITADDATQEELDHMTRRLLVELQETEVESAELISAGEAPEGSKGDPITIGALAMTVLPVVLPGVIDLIKDWSARKAGRTVKFKSKGIEFEGSAEDLDRLLATLNKGKK